MRLRFLFVLLLAVYCSSFCYPAQVSDGEEILFSGTPKGIALSPGETTLATLTSQGIWIWDLRQENPSSFLLTGGDELPFKTCCENLIVFLDEERLLFVGSGAVVVRMENGAVAQSIDLPDYSQAIPAPESNRLILQHDRDTDGAFGFTVIDLTSGETITERRFGEIDNDLLLPVALSPDESLLFVSGLGGLGFTVNTATLAIERYFSGAEESIFSGGFSPDGTHFVAGTRFGQMLKWDVASGRLLFRFSNHPGLVARVQYHPGGGFLMAQHEAYQQDEVNDITVPVGEAELLKYDAANGSARVLFSGNSYPPFQFRKNAGSVVAFDRGFFIAEWDFSSGDILRRFGSPSVFLRDLSPDNQRLAAVNSGSENGVLFDVESKRIIALLTHPGGVSFAEFSPYGAYLLTGDQSGYMRLWDAETGELIHTLDGHIFGIVSVEFSGDNRFMLSSSTDGAIHLWALETGVILKTIDQFNHPGGFFSGARDMRFIRQDSEILLIIQDQVETWQLDPLEQLTQVELDTPFSDAKFPSGSSRVYVTSPDGLYFIDTETGGRSDGPAAVVGGIIDIHPSLPLILIETISGASLFNAQTGQELYAFSGVARFSPDGQLLYGTVDETLRRWDIKTFYNPQTPVGEFMIYQSEFIGTTFLMRQ